MWKTTTTLCLNANLGAALILMRVIHGKFRSLPESLEWGEIEAGHGTS